MYRFLTSSFFLLVLPPIVGCGVKQAQFKNDLKQTGLAYHNFHDTNKQGPANWDELIAFDPNTADAVARVRDAGYQMKWNVKFSDVTEGLSNAVMAEHPNGGPKIMMDGAVLE